MDAAAQECSRSARLKQHERPQSTGWLYLHVPGASQERDSYSVRRDQPHSYKFLDRRRFFLINMLALVNLHYC